MLELVFALVVNTTVYIDSELDYRMTYIKADKFKAKKESNYDEQIRYSYATDVTLSKSNMAN